MENLIPYIKLIILALACLVTGVCTLSRKWYVNLPVFLICIAGETFMAYLFFPAYKAGKKPWSMTSSNVFSSACFLTSLYDKGISSNMPVRPASDWVICLMTENCELPESTKRFSGFSSTIP